MLNVVEKHSQFIGTYFCVYLDDWLVLQTKNAKLAKLCGMGRFPPGLLNKAPASEAASKEPELEMATA